MRNGSTYVHQDRCTGAGGCVSLTPGKTPSKDYSRTTLGLSSYIELDKVTEHHISGHYTPLSLAAWNDSSHVHGTLGIVT